ncbi:hypothetical protein JJJA_0063 [Achromobacter phage JWDelta]|uniref:Uncharacterized protein n=2 Tax=Jwalphavirus jwalpha TaxID=2169963 RepID=V9VEJ9_9CAUD|nr:hypothetical protein CH29_gp66 [Achromobacter phage JWAlpha]AHC56579.1 hypothetical protein JJJA_0063 [Achromobacter phage JWDelta]AHC94019.1 hypothetical protein JJJB_0066 [Achromobacter phage JWAlpha]
MQITLVQSEIEQALKNYINEQVNVKEGMEIVIVLKATRGEEGTTAVIDITKPIVVQAPAKTVRAVTSKVEAAPKEEPKPTVEPKEDPPFDPDAQAPAQASAPESSASTDGAPAQTSNAANASAEEAPAKPSKPSLFANLGK